MTRPAVISRNRLNALKSTGPRTQRGKLVISGNALQHGATARPAPEKVAIWLRIILDQPSLGLEGLISGDDQIARALALAEAEARLSACEEALMTFEERADKSKDIFPDLLRHAIPIIEEFKTSFPKGSRPRHANKILERIIRRDIDGIVFGGTRHRLLLRYRDEARSNHRRAFQDWIAFLEREQQD